MSRILRLHNEVIWRATRPDGPLPKIKLERNSRPTLIRTCAIAQSQLTELRGHIGAFRAVAAPTERLEILGCAEAPL